MVQVSRGLVLVGCVSVGFVISAGPGLVARAAEPDRWVSSIVASATAAQTEAAQRRIAELEQKVKDLEAQSHVQLATAKSAEVAALARTEELAARNRELILENQELAQSRMFEASQPASSAVQSTNDADPRVQLRYLARQIRDGEANSRRLSPRLNAAVNVILRGERELDPNNPWREQP
jgi:hypothetical protein